MEPLTRLQAVNLKPGDTIICIDNNDVSSLLVVGQEYVVRDEKNDYSPFVKLVGVVGSYYHTRFALPIVAKTTCFKDGKSLKPGDKVKCIDGYLTDLIEIGKVYEVGPDHGCTIDNINAFIRVIIPGNPNSGGLGYFAWKFAPMDEDITDTEVIFEDVTNSWAI